MTNKKDTSHDYDKIIDLELTTDTDSGDNSDDINADPELAAIAISAKKIKITLTSELSMSGVRIPAHGSGYFPNYVKIIQNYAQVEKCEIAGPDLTPAGPSGTKKVTKVLENIPPGRSVAQFELMSYWKHGGRMRYSTYAVIEADGVKKWEFQVVSTPGQKNPRYESARIKLELTE